MCATAWASSWCRRPAIAVTVISQGTTGAIRERMRKLGVDEAHFGIEDKAAVLRDICARRNIKLLDVLHVADDVNDLTILAAVGFPVAVADAVPQVKAQAFHVTENKGGNGAVRELCDAILAAQQEHP
jgi:3-deoxy-D-manno-octulosonate 8-phosphate phosphatase (KDO 8-P phosphatase)